MDEQAETTPAASLRGWQAVVQPTRIGIIAGILGALLFAGVGYVATLRAPAAYLSQAVLVIDQPIPIAGASGEGIIVKLNALRVKYLFLARTQTFTKPVAEKLKIPFGEVARSVFVTAPGPSLGMFVSAKTGSPQRSQQIANAMAEQLITYVRKEQEAAKVSPAQRIVFTVVDSADPGRKIQPSVQRARSVAALAAFAGFALLYGIAQFRLVRGRS
jgi:uncharacterized protein involved in exopolysaccharide biosynthesis